jgi:hypothetical protein
MLRNVCALLAVVSLGIGSLCAQSPAPPTTPATKDATKDIDALWSYAGTWKIETENFDTPYSKAGKKVSSLHNDCWRSGEYIACRQIVDGDPKVLIVFTCTRPDHYCTTYQIPTDGSGPNSGTMLVEGNVWTFPWQTTDGGKTTYFRVVNVWSSPTSLDYRQEFSTDKVNWTKTASGHEFKTNSN